MNTTAKIISLSAGLLAAVTASANDTAATQVLAAATLMAAPTISQIDSRLNALTEAAINQQLASIDARLTLEVQTAELAQREMRTAAPAAPAVQQH